MIKGIIFDLDGTLLNTIEDITDSINIALNEMGFIGDYTTEEMKYFVGSGVDILVQKAIAKYSTEEAKKNELKERYNFIYGKRKTIKTAPYEGTIELLKELRKKNITIALLSNKPHQDTLEVIDHYFGLENFDYPFGKREGIPTKPSPKGVFLLLDEMKLKPEEVLYIGDSDIDMKTAKNAHLTKIGVTWGFRTREELQVNDADYIIDSPNEILKILKCNC